MADLDDKLAGIGRRELLTGAGLAVAATALTGTAVAATGTASSPALWDFETDVVCVGSGAAACGAAVTAVGQGAQVILVEKLPLLGGTTGKSGGVTWIPNNPILRARGLVDRKEDCLQYLARYAYPQLYTPDSPTLGLPELQYRLLEAFYDNGTRMVDNMARLDAVHFKEFRLFQVERPAPDYADHLPENKTPNGRSLEPAVGSGSSQGGGSLASQLEAWLRKRNVQILTEHRVLKLVKSGERVIGIEAQSGDKLVRIKARRGVVFGTGGYAHNPELIGLHQVALYGSCAASGATGDFIPIAQEVGARMGSLHTAWRTQVLFEEALENRMLGFAAFVLPGDSMIVVNKYGKRVCNEKRDYNDRTMTHFVFDATREEYPNHLLYLITDARSLDAFGGAFPFPRDKRESRWLIEAATIDELATKVGERLAKIASKSGGEKLAPGFVTETKAAIERFNGYAEKGRDPEFDRGLHDYDREWHLLFSARREGTQYPVNPKPNITMHPFTKTGPYYAFILAAGALDTNGGPQINEKAQVLAANGKPLPGLYGAGNCIASPSRAAYYGAGGTIGLALTYGYIAGMNVAAEPATA
jgi:glycine/D-amino acid oxidase-like deaminating enzyme